MTQLEEDTASSSSVAKVDMKLEVVVIPVSNADRAKEFYGRLGWRLDADFRFENGFRVVQFTPAGSESSIRFGTKVTPAAPGSAQSLDLGVSHIVAARAQVRLDARSSKPAEVKQRSKLRGLKEVSMRKPIARECCHSRTAQSSQLYTTATLRRRRTTKSLADPNLSLPAPPRTFSLW